MARLDREDLDYWLRTRWAPSCGLAVRKRRRLLGMSQEQLSTASGVPEGTISKVELGRIVPRDDLRIALAHSLGCEVEELWRSPSRERLVEVAEEFAIAGAAA